MTQETERPPAGNRGPGVPAGGETPQTLAAPADTGDGGARSGLLDDLTALTRSLNGYLVLSLAVDDDGHRRTTVYRSVAACERAVQRARERGRHVEVSLCQLMPVGVVTALTTRGR